MAGMKGVPVGLSAPSAPAVWMHITRVIIRKCGPFSRKVRIEVSEGRAMSAPEFATGGHIRAKSRAGSLSRACATPHHVAGNSQAVPEVARALQVMP